MRILLVTEPSGGGSGRHVVDLAGELTRRGHQVCVVYSPTRAEAGFKAELAALPLWATEQISMRRAVGPWDVAAARGLRSLIDGLGPFDVVHSHSSKAGALARLVTPKGAARIYTPHAFRTMDPKLTAALRLLYGSIERGLSLMTDSILVGSTLEYRYGAEIGIRKEKLRVVPFGIHKRKLPTRAHARQRLGLPQDATVVGFVGRLERQKAPHRAIGALEVLRRKDVVLAVVGDGELMATLKEMVARSGLADRVRFTGWLDGGAAMPAFDLLLIPSLYESLGYVYLEAAQAGIPVVTVDTGIAGDLYGSGSGGLIVANSDEPEVWASALSQALEPEKLTELRRSASEIADRFSVEAMTTAVEDCYVQALGGIVR